MAWVPQPDWESSPEYRWVPSRDDEPESCATSLIEQAGLPDYLTAILLKQRLHFLQNFVRWPGWYLVPAGKEATCLRTLSSKAYATSSWRAAKNWSSSSLSASSVRTHGASTRPLSTCRSSNASISSWNCMPSWLQ